MIGTYMAATLVGNCSQEEGSGRIWRVWQRECIEYERISTFPELSTRNGQMVPSRALIVGGLL